MRKLLVGVMCVWFVFVGQAIAASPAVTVAAPATAFLWKITSETGTVYLLGSVHYAKENLYPLDSHIEEAYGKADIVSFEIDPGAIGKKEMEAFNKVAVYTEGDTIEHHLSAKTLDILKAKLKQMEISYDSVKAFQPWALSMSLANVILQKAGYNPQLGIDMYFFKKAKDAKPIFELESFAEQIELLSGLDEKEQELLLLYTLVEAETAAQEVEKIFTCWKTGNAKGLEKIIQTSVEKYPELQPLLDKFLAERNEKMAACLEEYLKTEATYFVIAGAAHLVGEKGILELLRTKGYKIQQQ